MSAPTPREVFDPATSVERPPVFAAGVYARRYPAQARRKAALVDAHRYAEQLTKALGALLSSDESDVDLALERYRRVADRVDAALDELDAALEAGPPLPVAHPATHA